MENQDWDETITSTSRLKQKVCVERVAAKKCQELQYIVGLKVFMITSNSCVFLGEFNTLYLHLLAYLSWPLAYDWATFAIYWLPQMTPNLRTEECQNQESLVDLHPN